MLHPSTQQLIRKLYELTSAGSLSWTEGVGDASRLETEGYVVEITASPPALRLLRADGRELETATTEDLASVAWPSGDGGYATRVAEMAGRARRIALGAEKAIAAILSSLSAPAIKIASHPAPGHPVASFGETPSFAAPATVEPAPPPAPAQARTPPNMLTHGISARSVQSVEQSTSIDLQRLASAQPSPQHPLRPAGAGPNIYKPWN